MMNGVLFDGLDSNEMRLLIDLDVYRKPFLLNDVFSDLNHSNLSRLAFYEVFFGLITLGLVRVEHIPQEMVNGLTNITYTISNCGKAVRKAFLETNPELASKLS